ncbi:hypothetical protein GQ600_16698 [Phytophthora cactorum]|nr:hypothetical protein GQ600_16698 [Phytophthora cactorum]
MYYSVQAATERMNVIATPRLCSRAPRPRLSQQGGGGGMSSQAPVSDSQHVDLAVWVLRCENHRKPSTATYQKLCTRRESREARPSPRT